MSEEHTSEVSDEAMTSEVSEENMTCEVSEPTIEIASESTEVATSEAKWIWPICWCTC
jgi:hypothetical protein